MKAFFFASLFLLQSTAAAQTFVDQVDGYTVIVCKDVDGHWSCKDMTMPVLELYYGVVQCVEHGWIDDNGLVMIDEPVRTESER